MHNFKTFYPALQNFCYLNTAAHGLVSASMVKLKSDLQTEFLNQGSHFTNQGADKICNVRKTVAQFLESDSHLTALLPNFSIGLNLLLDLIDRDKKFLLIDGDYPSINHAIESRGFKFHRAGLDRNLENNILKACEKHQPDFLAISVVQYISGIKIDLNFIKHLKQQFPDLIIIADATQYIGTEPFSFHKSGIDIMGSSCYKWLNAGEGNGFLTFKKEAVDRIIKGRLEIGDLNNVTNQRGSFLGYFEPGHHDLISFAGLEHAMKFAMTYGLEKINGDIKAVQKIALKSFIQRQLLCQEVIARTEHSSIFNLKAGKELQDRLMKNKILSSLRGEGVRVSFSYFNTLEDLDRLLDIIDKDL